MNVTDYTYIVNKPNAVNEYKGMALDKVIANFPYFQSARVLRLKHLYNQDSFKYNDALKVTAAYTTDRSVLFDFITSEKFVSVQNGLYEQKLQELLSISVTDVEVIRVTQPLPSTQEVMTSSVLETIQNAEEKAEPKHETPEVEEAKEKLALGKPLTFTKDEKHSFQEWLQLSRFKPIVREPDEQTSSETKKTPEISEEELEKQKKAALIDRFIENNPRISPVSKDAPIVGFEPKIEDKTYLMTETLAKVYLEQRKFSKAIQAYQILILKYPEKSSLFASRIEEIKKLQQNNNN